MKTNDSDRTVREYRVEDIGLEHSQFFQGRGVSPEHRWDDVAVGIGNSPAEALDDALESLAQAGWDFANGEPDPADEFGEDAEKDFIGAMQDEDGWDDHDRENCEVWYHVAVYVKE